MRDLGHRIKELMDKRKMRISDLAALMKVHPQTVKAWRAGAVPLPKHRKLLVIIFETKNIFYVKENN